MTRITPITAVPWGALLGSVGNTRSTPMTVAAAGRLLWSIPLPARAANGMVVAADGMIFVTTDQQLLAVESAGRVAWKIEGELMMHPAILPDGAMVLYDGEGLAVYNPANGQRLAHIPTLGITDPVVTPAGDLLFGSYDGDNLTSVLVSFSSKGTHRWTQPLAGALTGPPVFCGNFIVVSDERSLRTYTFDGDLIWSIAATDVAVLDIHSDGHKSIFAEPFTPATFRFPLMRVGVDSVLGQVEHNKSYGYVLIDIHTGILQPLKTHLPPGAPVALVHTPQNTHIVTLDWPHQDDQQAWHSDVQAVTLDGRRVWAYPLTARPSVIITDTTGQTLIACSPSLDYWDKYRDWYHLADECFVRCLTPDGAERWTWMAPGPLSSLLTVGANGEIYAVADGQLYALG